VADDEGSAFAFFVAPPSRRQGGIRFSSLAEAPFRGRQNLAQGGTGVLNTRRLCACWGGGTGALNMRLSRARNSRGRKSRACWSDRSPGNLSANSSKPLQGRHNLTRLQRKLRLPRTAICCRACRLEALRAPSFPPLSPVGDKSGTAQERRSNRPPRREETQGHTRSWPTNDVDSSNLSKLGCSTARLGLDEEGDWR